MTANFVRFYTAVNTFGMFRFRTRGFVSLGVLIMAIYALLIALLVRYQPDSTNAKLEWLLWVAYALTLAQFSFLAGMVGELRRKVGDKNQELARQNAELQTALQRIHDMAIRDELTGVYNRRFVMERITEESVRCIRSGSVFCLCMLDIDFFKKVNDTYGHLGGDDVLRHVAHTAAKTLRQADLFGRYGGEEFVLLLNDTTLEGALVTAERLRTLVEGLRFDDIAQDLRVTISIGVAEHVRKTDAAATLRRADEALYRAKESGRNRSIGAPTPDAPAPSVTPPPWP
ncbi:GGDEF domain-containing protein [Rhodoferax sp.]|uniref:GGDEF domain-containing protein n=1 Tax=Rhodoferax sp. TaxID=50421 RepID=UPI00274A4FD5|nr:GGDEF domain-containing protein [Rhodoferax sp.]